LIPRVKFIDLRAYPGPTDNVIQSSGLAKLDILQLFSRSSLRHPMLRKEIGNTPSVSTSWKRVPKQFLVYPIVDHFLFVWSLVFSLLSRETFSKWHFSNASFRFLINKRLLVCERFT